MCKLKTVIIMMDLGFLKDVKLEVVKKAASVTRTTTPKLPVDADLRVFGSGRVYPSAAFAEEYKLEFLPKETLEGADAPTVVVGNGLDIFSSKKWGMIMGKLPQELVFVAAVAKSLPKVDMWASTKYEVETNTPKASVFLQGASTFSKNVLVDMLADVYGISWGQVEYVDFSVSRENVISSENGIYHLPKIVSTGKHAGEDTYVRRENLTICPLVIVHEEPKAVAEVKEVANMDKAINKADEMFTTADVTDTADQEGLESNTEPTEEAGEDWAAKLGAPVNE
jgi:hypothetical protein